MPRVHAMSDKFYSLPRNWARKDNIDKSDPDPLQRSMEWFDISLKTPEDRHYNMHYDTQSLKLTNKGPNRSDSYRTAVHKVMTNKQQIARETYIGKILRLLCVGIRVPQITPCHPTCAFFVSEIRKYIKLFHLLKFNPTVFCYFYIMSNCLVTCAFFRE